MRNYNGVSILPGQSVINSPEDFSCDACTAGGCGAICLGEYFHEVFPDFIMVNDPPVSHLELLTVVVCMKLWQERLKEKVVTIYSDSETAVKAITNKRSQIPFMQACLRELYGCLALSNITLVAEHVAGKKNILADYLSRWHLKPHYSEQFHILTRDRSLIECKVDQELFCFSY